MTCNEPRIQTDLRNPHDLRDDPEQEKHPSRVHSGSLRYLSKMFFLSLFLNGFNLMIFLVSVLKAFHAVGMV